MASICLSSVIWTLLLSLTVVLGDTDGHFNVVNFASVGVDRQPGRPLMSLHIDTLLKCASHCLSVSGLGFSYKKMTKDCYVFHNLSANPIHRDTEAVKESVPVYMVNDPINISDIDPERDPGKNTKTRNEANGEKVTKRKKRKQSAKSSAQQKSQEKQHQTSDTGVQDSEKQHQTSDTGVQNSEERHQMPETGIQNSERANDIRPIDANNEKDKGKVDKSSDSRTNRPMDTERESKKTAELDVSRGKTSEKTQNARTVATVKTETRNEINVPEPQGASVPKEDEKRTVTESANRITLNADRKLIKEAGVKRRVKCHRREVILCENGSRISSIKSCASLQRVRYTHKEGQDWTVPFPCVAGIGSKINVFCNTWENTKRVDVIFKGDFGKLRHRVAFSGFAPTRYNFSRRSNHTWASLKNRDVGRNSDEPTKRLSFTIQEVNGNDGISVKIKIERNSEKFAYYTVSDDISVTSIVIKGDMSVRKVTVE